MTTINGVNLGLSGSTGSVHFVGSTSPTLVTPTLGSATATSLTFSPTTNGIVGTTTNDNAAAGYVGQFISSSVLSGSPVNISNMSATDLTSISLTAGDWDVYGNVFFNPTGVSTQAVCWISSTSATLPEPALTSESSASISGTETSLVTPFFRASLTSTTTIYISAYILFSTGTASIAGNIYARRAR